MKALAAAPPAMPALTAEFADGTGRLCRGPLSEVWATPFERAAQPVRCWKQPERVICLRHRRWICPLTRDDQPDLSNQPEIIQAHKRHLRLVRRFGRNPTASMFAVADHICRRWHEQRQHDQDFRRRMAIFHGPDWRVPPTDPTISASIYPQVVALTRLLISPHWQALTKSIPDGRDRFLQELRGTVAAGYTWPDKIQSPDPLHRWLYQRWLVKPDPFLFSVHSWPMTAGATTSRSRRSQLARW